MTGDALVQDNQARAATLVPGLNIPGVGGDSSPNVPPVITSAHLAPSTSTSNPSTTPDTSPQNALGASLAAFGSKLQALSDSFSKGTSDTSDAGSATGNSRQSILDRLMGDQQELNQQGADTQAENDKEGIAAKTQAVTDITNEYNTRGRYYDDQITALDKNPQGFFGTGLQQEKDRILGQKNQELADIAIRQSAANGDLTTAQTIAKQVIDAKYAPIQAEIDNLTKYYQLSQNDMTDSEKMQAQAAIDEKQAQADQARQKELLDYQEKIKQADAVSNGDNTPSNTSTSYTLAAGDDPYNIAQNAGIDMATLQKLNPDIQDWHNIPVGAKLNLPLPAGTLSTNPTVDSYANGILNGSITSIASVPAQYKDAVTTALNAPGQNGYSPLASSRFSMASNRIVNNYIDLPQYQLTANGLPYLQRIQAATQTPGSVSDQDLLDSLTKLNTAGNAISDAQVKLITDGRSLADTVSVATNKLGNGGVLSDSQRAQIVKIANAIYANYKTGYQPVYDQATAQLKAAGIPQAFWTIPDLNTLSDKSQSTLNSGATGTLSSGITYTIE